MIDVAIAGDGDFSIAASEAQVITAIKIPDVLQFDIHNLSIGKEENWYFIAPGGQLDIIAQPAGIYKLLPDKLDIQKLLIQDDGKVEFEGGSIYLNEAMTLKAGPVELSVTAVHYGTIPQLHNGNNRQYQFFGFDGGIGVNPGGVDARGDGIKYFYTNDGGPFDILPISINQCCFSVG